MDLSIVIVSYNTKDLTDNCLSSIYHNADIAGIEIIVIDNASSDGSADFIMSKYPQVRLGTNDQNVGFAKACNQGIRCSSGKYLFFLNPDTYVTENVFKTVITFFEHNPEVGMAGCHLYYPNGRPQRSFFKFTSISNLMGRSLLLNAILPQNKITNIFFPGYPENEIPKYVDRVYGAAMIARKEALEKAGLFDESYFMYSEEEDLCFRIRKAGWLIAPIPDSRVFHYQNQSTISNLRKSLFSSYQGQFLFYRKFHSFPRILFFRLIQLAGMPLRILFWSIVFVSNPTGREMAKQRLLAYLSIGLSNFDYSKCLLDKKNPCV